MLAANALSNINAALEKHKTIQKTVKQNSKRAWSDNNPNTTELPVTLKSSKRNATRDQAIKMARFYTVFGFAGGFFVVALNYFQSLAFLRPHGTITAIFFTVGMFLPSLLILNNPKLKAYVVDHFKRDILPKLNRCK